MNQNQLISLDYFSLNFDKLEKCVVKFYKPCGSKDKNCIQTVIYLHKKLIVLCTCKRNELITNMDYSIDEYNIPQLVPDTPYMQTSCEDWKLQNA